MGRSSELWIWKTSAACSGCSRPVELLGNDFHHAEESDHAVEVVVHLVPESELPRLPLSDDREPRGIR
jgi:hypothetical protein